MGLQTQRWRSPQRQLRQRQRTQQALKQPNRGTSPQQPVAQLLMAHQQKSTEPLLCHWTARFLQRSCAWRLQLPSPRQLCVTVFTAPNL